MSPNPDNPNGGPALLTSTTAWLVALWAVAFGLASAALWEGLELIDVAVRHDVVHDGLALVVVLYAIGATIGLVHGAAVAYLGRAHVEQRRSAIGEVLVGALLAVPVCAAGLTVGWPLSLSSYAAQAEGWANWAVPLVSWFIVLLTFTLAIAAAECSLCRFYARWRLGRSGLVLGLGVLTAAWVGLTIFGQRYPLTFGARLFAAGGVAAAVTLWIVLPLATCGVRSVRPLVEWIRARSRVTGRPVAS